MAELDHLVVAAPSLADGVRWCAATLGVMPISGGEHPLMGTHNRLVNLSSPAFPRCYLEIIAINPAAPPPGRARWYGLDTLDLSGGPRLIHAVLRSTRLDADREALCAAGFDPGPALGSYRDTPNGRLHWRILVRDDGCIAGDGHLPTLIEWPDTHPAEQLPPRGLSLQACTLAPLPAAAEALLPAQGWSVGSVLSATLATPAGPRTLTA